MYCPATAGLIINACFVLHNMLIEAKYPLPTEEEISEEIDDQEEEMEDEVALNPHSLILAGIQARNKVVREYF